MHRLRVEQSSKSHSPFRSFCRSDPTLTLKSPRSRSFLASADFSVQLLVTAVFNVFRRAQSGDIDTEEVDTSSETQGQSVGSGEKAGRKFSSTGGRAPGYRLSPDHFQKFKRMPAPDWAQKMLCIIVPNRPTVSPEFFS